MRTMKRYAAATATGAALFLAAYASAQEVHGVIAYGSEAGQENSIAYGFAWNFPAKDAARAEAMNACISSGGTNCIEVAWFANGCGALAIDQHGNAQGKPGMTQEQAEERALRTCEAVGGLGCNIVGSLCVSPKAEPGTYSGSESVLPVEGAQAAVTTEAENETFTREERVLVQQSLTALGFNTGPADGVFGHRTRTAIRDWQSASGYEVTGEVTRNQFATLTAAGDRPTPAQEQEQELRQETADNQSDKVLIFGPDTGPKCADGETTEDGFCWVKLANKKSCYYWYLLNVIRNWARLERADWSGECVENTAHGTGTVSYTLVAKEDKRRLSGEARGEFAYGYRQGRWITHGTTGTIWEAQYVDGKAVGWVTSRRTDGHIIQYGTKENGELEVVCQRHKLPGESRWREHLGGEDGCP